MLIHEVSRITDLTKKAIEYYTLKGLISPAVLENGYRDYSENDIEQLNKISVLRKLGISTEEIKRVMADKSGYALQVITVNKELSLQREKVKKAILEKLSKGHSYTEVSKELQAIDNCKTITAKILEAFPGYYGRFICMHFARFLNEPIKTVKQQAAYDRIISFLDNVPALNLPEDLQSFLYEGTKYIDTEQISEMLVNTKESIENPDDFLSNYKEVLEQYLAYRQSDEYKESPAYKIMELMKDFNRTSGYNDVFIPALKELSSSYSQYYKQLEKANEKLLERFPGIVNNEP